MNLYCSVIWSDIFALLDARSLKVISDSQSDDKVESEFKREGEGGKGILL